MKDSSEVAYRRSGRWRRAAIVSTRLLALVAATGIVRAAETNDVLVRIGIPDGAAAELGLAREGYAAFRQLYSDPIRYTVGTSRFRDWPFVHPAHRDGWAGGKPYTFRIDFDATKPPPAEAPLYLVIGIVGAHATERSTITITVNGQALPTQVAPPGNMATVFTPLQPGRPDTIIFDVPPGAVHQGNNEVTIRLDTGSWILYDYVALRGRREPLPLQPFRPPPPPDILRDALKGPMTNVEEIVFALRQPGKDGHWYANFGYYADSKVLSTHFDPADPAGKRLTYGDGGKLSVLNLRTGDVRVLLDDPKGGVRDPVVHYDGDIILFSYRPGGTPFYHLYTIGADGSGLTPLTDGPFDDIEPTWLPDGGIMFVSSRCKRWVNCWVTQVAVLHRCNADGTDIRAVSANIEHDNTPWVLPDGRILYQRWEYVDRSQVDYHHLWTMNPDGTGQIVYFGNMHPGTVMIDAKPIPPAPDTADRARADKIVAIFSPGHGRREHDGVVTIVDPSLGPDASAAARAVSRTADLRDPWAFSEDCFLAAHGTELVLLNGLGGQQPIYRCTEAERAAGLQCHEPRPLVRRPREHVIPARVKPAETTGRLVLANIYDGRNMEGVKPGDIKKLLVLESLPKPINFTGGMDPLTYGGSFTLERILGTVPVEPDGSAYMELPAMRALFFVALDENDLSVKRMHSFLTVQPGEVTSCVGCHEQRTSTLLPHGALQAMAAPPARLEPIEDCPDVFDFPRDIQPILDRNCTACHGYERTERGGPYAGRTILTGDHGPMFSHAYFTMTVRRLFSDGRNLARGNYAPREVGSSASRILKKLAGGHHDVHASEHETRMMRLWIETGAPYPGTYGALGCGAIGGYAQNQLMNNDAGWPTTKAGSEVIGRRCASCHKGHDILPRTMSDERGISFWRFNMDDPRLKLSRHIVFNLSRPEHSLLLLAPLARAAGGFERCHTADGQPATVFADTADPDYRTLLAMIAAGKENLDTIKRFDMPDFQPRPEYVREMKRYGILPADLPLDAAVNPYETDRAYWQSLHYRPSLGTRTARR